MDRDECLKKLEEACKKLENIGNVVEFKKNNPNGFFGIILPVIQYYKFIQTNFKNDEFALVESMGIVLEVGENNPSLKGVVESIISSKKKTKKEENIRKATEELFDKSAFVNKTTAIVNEFKEQTSINTNTVGDSQYLLEKCLEELNDNIQHFSQEEYQELLIMISKELEKIKRLNEYLENNNSLFKM